MYVKDREHAKKRYGINKTAAMVAFKIKDMVFKMLNMDKASKIQNKDIET